MNLTFPIGAKSQAPNELGVSKSSVRVVSGRFRKHRGPYTR